MKTAIGLAILLTEVDHMCWFVHHSTTAALASTNPTLFTLSEISDQAKSNNQCNDRSGSTALVIALMKTSRYYRYKCQKWACSGSAAEPTS